MTSVIYLGHACFLFETERAACLIDPWLSPKGAFLGTWRQLPPNDRCLDWVMEKMKQKATMIYVTHEHEDHYDEETLKKLLPLSHGITIPDYENGFLRELIRKNLGALPTLVKENEPRQFQDITFRIFIDESGINRDSAIFLKDKNLSFLDTNDCKIYDRAPWLREQCGPIDILSAQFSGANMHPICYEMSPEDYMKVSRQKKMRKFMAIRQFIADLQPKHYLPSAGPAVFPLQEHLPLNFERESIFPKWWEFQDYLKEKKVDVAFTPLNPGGAAATGDDGLEFYGVAERLDESEIREMIAYYQDVDAKAPPTSAPAWNEVIAFFEKEMNAKIDVLKANPGVTLGCPLYFEINDDNGKQAIYLIHPERLTLEKRQTPAYAPPYYVHTTTAAALGKLMRSGKGWGTYFLSFMFRNKRVPDTFDTVMATFFVANDAQDLDFGLKKLVEFKESKETVTLTAPDGKTEVTCKRFCPHQGGDLKYAAFDGKYVTCPRHRWKFDCANGGKADNSDDTIDAVIKNKQV